MTKLVQPSFLFFEVMTEQPQVRIGKLMPNWMINLTDRIMQYYIDRYLNCDPVVLDRPPEPQPGHQYLLYAHIPFCKTLCSYCTFHRFLFKEHKAREYFVNLRKEMDYVKALGYDFTSMYIGGGTPTILDRTRPHAFPRHQRSVVRDRSVSNCHPYVPQSQGARGPHEHRRAEL